MSNAMRPEPMTPNRSESPAAPIFDAPQPRRPVDDLPAGDEFDYKPIPMLAPVTLFLGVSSLLVLVSEFGLIIAAVGMILGTICMVTVAKNRGEIGGYKMTVVGLAASVVCLFSGSAKLYHDYTHEVPEGFARVNFNADISKKGFVNEGGDAVLHPDVAALDGQKVFLKGFMYPSRKHAGIQEFVLAKDNGDCCFGGQPKITDMIYVRVKAPKSGVTFTANRVSVAGTFRAGKRNQSEEGLSPVYELEALYFEPSRTSF